MCVCSYNKSYSTEENDTEESYAVLVDYNLLMKHMKKLNSVVGTRKKNIINLKGKIKISSFLLFIRNILTHHSMFLIKNILYSFSKYIEKVLYRIFFLYSIPVVNKR